MARQKSKKGKGLYAVYKTDNRAEKNKIKKLTRHCKKFPNDLLCAKRLEEIKEKGYVARSKPLVPGSNPTIPKPKFYNPVPGYLHYPTHIKTPGEQLSELLGIPVPKPRRKFKPKITHKPRRK